MDPSKFREVMREAAHWDRARRTKGCAGSKGCHAKQRGQIKRIRVRPLRGDARQIMSDPDSAIPTPPKSAPKPEVERMRSLSEELEAIPDFCQAAGRRLLPKPAESPCVVLPKPGARPYTRATHLRRFSRTERSESSE